MTSTFFRPALVLFAALTLITGVIYPLAVTGAAATLFPAQAAGSLSSRNGALVGSTLIGQNFKDPKYFWGRPSATAPAAYDAAASGGSNRGPLDPALLDAAKGRLEALRAADPGNAAAVPVDLASASASGLDPDITPAAAYYQAPRVSRVRELPKVRVDELIEEHTEGKLWGLLGEARVNVLALNLALDELRR